MNRERPSASRESESRVESWNGAQRADGEGLTVILLRDRSVVEQVNLGVKATSKHALVVADDGVVDAHVAEPKARQFGDVGVRLCVEPSLDEVDELDRHALASACD